MADGLFDNRYRYDYIYPRGRSGETLRAVDTAQAERPVVIKRPAPNDAPPIRAGQEVSILNERKALTRLAGHPVLTELLGGGQFFVGGMPHQYIVVERAEGSIVSDTVLEYSAQGQLMPQLEMLVILDYLLDLLQSAHSKEIIYNDVDAKHLFWDRAAYRLKLIDWGNAVFLEGDEVTPQGISRQSDILQVGELMYFILSGGGRVDMPRDAGEDYVLNFGAYAERVSPRLQTIVTKAVHPNLRLRYRTIQELRRDLNEFRVPLERERDGVVTRVQERLKRNLSKNELRGLLNMLEPALSVDPGHPQARQAHDEINDRLRDLDVSADLDAVRIYMEGGNWSRAAGLLNELRDKTGPRTGALVNLLVDYTMLLIDAHIQHTPEAVQEAVALMFAEDIPGAASALLTIDTPDNALRKLQWLLAERISARIPEVLLLRPNLYRLELALISLPPDDISGDSDSLERGRAQLTEINTLLDTLARADAPNMVQLRDSYRVVVDRLTLLSSVLEPLAARHNLPNRKLPLTSLDRAMNAAMALADNMHVIGKQAVSSPRDALVALDSSRAIDPTNPVWETIDRMLNHLYDLLQSYQIYVPAADGTDLDSWLHAAQADLTPFMERLFDEMLAGMIQGLKIARAAWTAYADSAIQGDRVGALTALADATEAVGTISPTLSGWLNQLRVVVDGAQYIERHAIFGGLGRALADGWEAYDRGRLPDAERLGQQAQDIARSDADRFAARRLLTLAASTRDWVERNGVSSASRTQSTLATVEGLYTEEENEIRENFAAQMPSRETYLRAMNKGLVELYARSSTSSVRILFFSTILLGTLEAHDANLDDALFWKEVAVRALGGERGQRHIATRTLDEFIDRRRDINAAAALLNRITGVDAIPTLEATRRQLEENAQARVFTGAIHSLREFEASLRDWADGEFRAAGLKLENAINAIAEAEQSASVTLTGYRAWLMELQAASAELHHLGRQMRQAIERRPADPPGIVREAHHRQADVTARLLGNHYAATLKQWRDTYESFLTVYTDTSVRRSARLSRFNELFRAMFIDRHPAYPLYRHWYDLTESSPEFPAPPTSDPTPRVADDTAAADSADYLGSRYVDTQEQEPVSGRRLPVRALMGAAGALLIVAILVALIVLSGGDDDRPFGGIAVTLSDTPDIPGTATAVALGITEEVAEALAADVTEDASAVSSASVPTSTPRASSTPRPTNTPPDTATPAPPTETETPAPPTATPTEAITNTPTPTPTPTLPPNGLQGQQDLFALLDRLPQLPWDARYFSPDTGSASWRLGVGTDAPPEEIFVSIPAATLDTYYGNNAPARIRRLEATLALTTYNPSLIPASDVYFGLLFQNADDPATTAGLHIQLVTPTAVNLWIRSGENLEFMRQVSVNAVIARVRLDRDPVSGLVTVFFNDAQIGQPLLFSGRDTPLLPVLYVQNQGGVIVNVTNWRVTLR